MELFDTHAHLCDERFSEDVNEVIYRAEEAGVTKILLASSDLRDSEDAIRMTGEKHGGKVDFFCSVGVHPHYASDYDDRSHERLISWLDSRADNRIVALGEIGLDYYYDLSPRDVQKAVFRRQMDLACSGRIPVIIHAREATADILEIVSEYFRAGLLPERPGVFHCFSGSAQTAQKIIEMGFYLGFDGPVTFKNNRKAGEVLTITPLDRILIETDCPYLTPEPFRGKRNEPAYVRYVLDHIARYLGKSPEDMARITTENAMRLFGYSSNN
ncbi:MAG: TatD family hydrolase [Clostridiales bacterium]|nr:TatD family hydrolase [Clostridiales bacterium]